MFQYFYFLFSAVFGFTIFIIQFQIILININYQFIWGCDFVLGNSYFIKYWILEKLLCSWPEKVIIFKHIHHNL